MKRLACLSLVVGLLSLPVPAQALTPEAANCALTLTVFRVFQVTGVNLAPPPEMLPGWINYLINTYPALPDPYSVANACWELGNIGAKWPQMPPVERELWLNMWTASLPNDRALIEPVSAGARQLRAALQSQAAQQNAAPSPTPNNEGAAIAELQRQYEIGNSLLRFNRTYYGP